MTYKESFLRFMVDCGVLTFGEFTLKSGRKAPYFINAGNYHSGAQLMELGRYYAACIAEHNIPVETVFGPAYKGIPLAAAAAVALADKYQKDVNFCFDRKEVKDHGEGGVMVGYKPQDGDRVAIVEDVVTAGTAVRESIALFQKVAPVKISSLFVSVDRMERGQGSCSTLDELRKEYGIAVHPIVTVRDIIQFLYERPIDGKVYIDHAMKERMEAYLRQYGAE